jgi:hypothetical protein
MVKILSLRLPALIVFGVAVLQAPVSSRPPAGCQVPSPCIPQGSGLVFQFHCHERQQAAGNDGLSSEAAAAEG